MSSGSNNNGKQSAGSRPKDNIYEYCNSESLSEEGLQEYIDFLKLINTLQVYNNNNNNKHYQFFINACCNDRVTEGIIQYLLQYCPVAASATADDGESPLHFACCNKNVTPKIVKLIIDAAPASIRSANNYGWMPLHVLCDNSEVDETAAIQILKLLIEKYPEAVRSADNDDDLPIHLACVSRSPEFCRVLIDSTPASIRSVNDIGWMPLHVLCGNRNVDEKGATMQVLKVLIEKYPEAVRHETYEGDLPIHLASMLRSPEFCRVLIEAHPGSERISNDSGALPLHLACWENNVPAVEYFHNLYPDARATTQGHYPIHDAIRGVKHRGNPADIVEIVKFLLGCDPNVKLQMFGGVSLLQFACEQEFDDSKIEVGIEIIKTIYDAHPEAIDDNRIASDIHNFHQQVQAFINRELVYSRQAKDLRLMNTPDDNGRLPLHNILQNNTTLGSIKLLVKGNPSAIRNFDNNGVIPLHVACEHHCSPGVVQYILGLDDGTLRAVDFHNNTALHYACRGAKYDTIALLLENYDAASVSKRNTHDKLPIELLWESDAVEDRESNDYTESIFRLLQAYPETLRNVGTQLQSTLAVSHSQIGRIGKKRKFGDE